MAQRCTIPCSINGVEWRIRTRALPNVLAPQLPLIGAGVVLLVFSPILIALANWQVALVAALFFALGIGVALGRALVQADESTHLAIPAELDRIIDEHEHEIHEARLAEFRAAASRLTYDSEDYRRAVTRFLEELRMTTGEAWRCPCRKRRLPIPLPGM